MAKLRSHSAPNPDLKWEEFLFKSQLTQTMTITWDEYLQDKVGFASIVFRGTCGNSVSCELLKLQSTAVYNVSVLQDPFHSRRGDTSRRAENGDGAKRRNARRWVTRLQCDHRLKLCKGLVEAGITTNRPEAIETFTRLRTIDSCFLLPLKMKQNLFELVSFIFLYNEI